MKALKLKNGIRHFRMLVIFSGLVAMLLCIYSLGCMDINERWQQAIYLPMILTFIIEYSLIKSDKRKKDCEAEN
ncbi:hypothetical protein JQC92_19085 [Shewanella sp. 202IG2-18]|uniref:hypothetical protein n=1 Tax=Parashewanella hymeniacidonis TaxID=2807618 RepID=UPI00195FBB65|nr:hypothetical protein [Parashewanella hymeniacidonis]MBM7074112.1 hypothetical protein [Parashewanella hymeniacidonis]